MKRAIITILALLAVGGISFGVLVGLKHSKNDNVEAQNYRTAMIEFRDAINDNTDGAAAKIVELSEKIDSTGDYASVEKAAKAYISDLLVPFYEATELQGNSIYSTSINDELIKAQQPEFKKSYEEMSAMADKLIKLEDATGNLFSKEAAHSYLEGELDQEFIDLFDDEVKEFYENEELKNKLIEYINTMQPITEYYTGILDFLVANNGSWHLEDSSIIFKTTSLTNQYNALIENKGF